MPRLKLPPYGKAIRDDRDNKNHPNWVVVHYSDKWAYPDGITPSIMLLKQDYAPGVFDFSFLAGLPVTVQVCDDVDTVPLMVELARFAAPVFTEAVWLGNKMWEIEASEAFYLYGNQRVFPCVNQPASDELLTPTTSPEREFRQYNGKGVCFPWPVGWSDQLELEYQRRVCAIEQFYFQRVTRELAVNVC